MKTILVHLEEHDSVGAMLEAAWLVADRFKSHIEGLHVRHGAPRLVPMGPEGAGLATTDLVESVERVERTIGAHLREQFERFAGAHGIPLVEGIPMSDEPTASFAELVAAGDEDLASRGRAFDLLVLGRPVQAAAGPRISALEAALFESGRPVLVVPPEAPDAIGNRIMIAWNGSTETALTIAHGMPFLAGASEILVLAVEEGMVAGPSARDVATTLMRHGFPARFKQVSVGSRNAIGPTFLGVCAEEGFDLMLKGAYTQSRLRQMIFGGATSHILGNATVPVLMAH
ncbi:MAG TPA: universal stress protein [Geminicoccaceae bacterium]